MKKDPSIYLEQILDEITTIDGLINDIGINDFQSNSICQNSVMLKIRIIARTIIENQTWLETANPLVTWKTIAALNSSLDCKAAWQFVQRDMPALKKQILKIKQNLQKK